VPWQKDFGDLGQDCDNWWRMVTAPSQANGEDADLGGDAAKRYEERARRKQPGFSLSALDILSD
jgi:hypothetical protein